MTRSGFRKYFPGLLQLIAIIVLSSGAYAADKNSERRANIDFDDELVEGSSQKPELFYLLQKKRFNYKRLIKLREDFIPEMMGTAQHVQGRGGNAE